MKKIVTKNLKSIITGSVIAGSLLSLNSCDSGNTAEELGNGDDVRKAVDGETTDAVKEAGEVAKEVEGKCGEGKCGEGKCGGDDKTSESKCGEGKCGEGKCGEK